MPKTHCRPYISPIFYGRYFHSSAKSDGGHFDVGLIPQSCIDKGLQGVCSPLHQQALAFVLVEIIGDLFHHASRKVKCHLLHVVSSSEIPKNLGENDGFYRIVEQSELAVEHSLAVDDEAHRILSWPQASSE